eukprot:Skav232039  [mRNA]  locus=scaffold2323:212133:213351:+ [translate_table: standard]
MAGSLQRGNFAGGQAELQKVQRDGNDKNLAIIRAAVSRSYTVDAWAIAEGAWSYMDNLADLVLGLSDWRPLHIADTALASIRDIEAQRRGSTTPWKSMRCPSSPLCHVAAMGCWAGDGPGDDPGGSGIPWVKL